jgi:uncharacterized damage-inducible protein DinB
MPQLASERLMKAQFAMLADYNTWANERLYEAVAAVPDSQYRSDLGAYFGSLHGTLNHVLVADRIWMHRLTGTGEQPNGVDVIACDQFGELRQSRRLEDQRIVTYVAGLSGDDLRGTMKYRTLIEPARIEQHLAPLLGHFFNHQTHHRGQAHCVLTRLGREAPPLDLLKFQFETGVSIVTRAAVRQR